jgi:NADH dehydrogenase [ubiquinone] 1 alpha subcomplex assembly factor 2
MWHQWLRYQREHPPSITEQSAEVARRERIKVLAKEADARWAAKASLLEKPVEKTPVLDGAAESSDPQMTATQDEREGGVRVVEAGNDSAKAEAPLAKDQQQNDPWKRPSGPSQTWQPTAWSPSSSTPKKR